MIWNFLSSLVSPITSAVTKVSTNKTEVKKRNIDRIINADDKLAEWEMIQAEKGSGWRDEWFTILLSIPLVGAFIPPFVPVILDGFEALNQMPTYYQYWVAVAILSSFGIRAIKK
jgi:hypothetical protein